PLYFRGLEKGKRQRESWEGAAVDPAVFAIQLSILNRMSFLGVGSFPQMLYSSATILLSTDCGGDHLGESNWHLRPIFTVGRSFIAIRRLEQICCLRSGT